VPSIRWSSLPVRGLQERAARAQPAEHVEQIGEWWLRRSTTSSWWMATVLPHGDAAPGELGRRIALAERFYATFEMPTRFQICPGACPEGLDATLAARGYRRDGAMSLQTSPVDAVRTSPPPNLCLRLTEAPTPEWFDVWYAVHGNGSDLRTERAMLDRVAQPSAYAIASDADRVVAVGRAVADAGWVGVFGMATLPAARGSGAGRGILTAAADWASTQAASGIYLQVERANAAALRLYARAGFAEAAAYHYRIA
jgi:GNAT superfamily N-acetyltransferase